MPTAENCRRKAAELLGAAEAATDPKTSASLRRTAELWTALALQIDQDPHTVRQRNAALQQSLNRNLRRIVPTPYKSRISCDSAFNSAILMSQSPNTGIISFLLIDSRYKHRPFIWRYGDSYEKWIKETRLDIRTGSRTQVARQKEGAREENC